MFAKHAVLPLLLASGLVLARATPETAVAPAPNEKQAETAAWVAQLLSNSRFHYQPLPLDDALSEKIYTRYLESLDSDKAFLLASDVESFSKYRTSFDDALRDRQLQPAFDMFNT